MEWQVWFAAVVFLVTFAVIISEKIHRSIIALFGAAVVVVFGVLLKETVAASSVSITGY